MLYLKIFWYSFLVFIVLYGMGRIFKIKRVNNAVEEYAMPFFMALFSLAIMAIATNDPITILGMELPLELQWLGSLLTAGFGTWQFYLRPLKEKLYAMDRELGEVRTDVKRIDKLECRMDRIENRMNLCDDKLQSFEFKMNSVEKEVHLVLKAVQKNT